MNSQIPSGWYEDPTNSENVRFWDGSAWTDNTKSKEAINTATDLSKEKGGSKKSAKELRADKKSSVERSSETFGKVICEGLFGLNTIKIYDKGFVSFDSQTKKSPEKLLAFEATDNISKKTGVGRSVATIASTLATPFPMFNLLSPNQRGDIYLVITTDKQVKTIHTSLVYQDSIKKAKELHATAAKVIEANAATPQTMNSNQDLSEQLAKLSELFEKGALSETEFSDAKRKLLGN